MNKLLLTFLIVFSSLGYAQQTKEVLFLGNSYTFVNDLPKLIQDIAISLGDSLIYDQNTPGGYTLQGHSTNTTSLSKIQSKKWDVVVLQEQSQRPSFSPTQVAKDVFPYAKQLVDKIKVNDSCSKTMFFMTWGRKYGDQQNCQSYTPVCTYSGMQNRLRESYVQMAKDNGVSVAPVGKAWKESIRNDSNLNLYASDNSHPSIYGSYLAACVFYSSIYHKSSVGASNPSNVNAGTAFVLQHIADQTVFDSLKIWRIDTATFITADFTYQVNAARATFQNNSSTNASIFYWDFGDGQFSTDSNPTHQYSQSGNFPVTLSSSVDCFEASHTDTVNILISAIESLVNNQKIKIFPIPVQDILHVKVDGNQIYTWKLIDSFGRVVKEQSKVTSVLTINIDGLPRGMYHIQLSTDSGLLTRKVLIE